MKDEHIGFDDPGSPKGLGPGKIIIIAVVCLVIGALLATVVAQAMQLNTDKWATLTTDMQQQAGESEDTPQPSETPAQSEQPSAQAQTDNAQPAQNVPSLGEGTAPSISADNPVVDIAKAVGPSVVGISNYTTLYQRGMTAQDLRQSSGSGFVVSNEGHIVTNYHVIEGSSNIKVLLPGGEEVDAKVVGSDPGADIAVLKVEGQDLTPVKFGDSDALQVGETAVAIGNPLGAQYAGTVTQGIISAVDRKMSLNLVTMGLIQTDAAINLGNSGGPLVNSKGEVIGITTRKAVIAGVTEDYLTVSAEGLGFAIPINEAKPIIEQLIKDGTVVRPGIGVSISTIDDEYSEKWELPKGVFVMSITAGGPAAQAGVRPNDVITKCDGVEVLTSEALTEEIQKHQPGETVELTIYRNGETLTQKVQIGDLNTISESEGVQESSLLPEDLWP